MKIERFCYGPEGTFSRAEIGEKTFYFCEPPWRDNKPNVSCIPEGTYRLRRDTTGRWQWYEVCDVRGRSQIELHPGNHIEHTDGCLLPGLGLGAVGGHWAVVNSTAAMRELAQIIEQEGIEEVTITFGEYHDRDQSAVARSSGALAEEAGGNSQDDRSGPAPYRGF